MALASSTPLGSHTNCGRALATPALYPRVGGVGKGIVRAQAEATAPHQSRRAALGFLAGVATVLSTKRCEAAYGEAANIFGKPTNTSGYLSYAGDGFSLLIPSKWNPGEERDFPGSILRWEDNGDQLTHVLVTKNPTDKTSIDQYGSPESFFDTISNYIGQQSFAGETISEGGFEANRVSAASLLGVSATKDKAGKTYYKYNLLIRAADGNEGGRHVLLSAAVGDEGDLFVAKVQCGEKRWFKGADKEVITALDSFTVA